MDLINPFRLSSGLEVLGYLMIVLVLSIIALSYNAVVLLTCSPHLLRGGFNSFFSLFIIILFHYLLVLLTWSYVMVVFWDPGFVPDNWILVLDEDSEEGNSTSISRNLGPEISASTLSSSDGTEIRHAVPYCSQCQNGKPCRCHHCSICKRCVLKTDHHCIWVVKCVGARNYKFFLLVVILICFPFMKIVTHSIGHEWFYCYYSSIFLWNEVIKTFEINRGPLAGVDGQDKGPIMTTRVYEKKKAVRWKYDLGRKRNFEQVFGSKKMFWFFPFFSEEDLKNYPAFHGLDFPTRSDTGE